MLLPLPLPQTTPETPEGEKRKSVLLYQLFFTPKIENIVADGQARVVWAVLLQLLDPVEVHRPFRGRTPYTFLQNIWGEGYLQHNRGRHTYKAVSGNISKAIFLGR